VNESFFLNELKISTLNSTWNVWFDQNHWDLTPRVEPEKSRSAGAGVTKAIFGHGVTKIHRKISQKKIKKFPKNLAICQFWLFVSKMSALHPAEPHLTSTTSPRYHLAIFGGPMRTTSPHLKNIEVVSKQPHLTSKKSRLFQNNLTSPRKNRGCFETTSPHLKKIEVIFKQPHLTSKKSRWFWNNLTSPQKKSRLFQNNLTSPRGGRWGGIQSLWNKYSQVQKNGWNAVTWARKVLNLGTNVTSEFRLNSLIIC
jgi:hypothetical protein